MMKPNIATNMATARIFSMIHPTFPMKLLLEQYGIVVPRPRKVNPAVLYSFTKMSEIGTFYLSILWLLLDINN